jgi:hypothetical protein
LDGIILHLKDPKESTKKKKKTKNQKTQNLLDLINTSGNVAGYKINTKIKFIEQVEKKSRKQFHSQYH